MISHLYDNSKSPLKLVEKGDEKWAVKVSEKVCPFISEGGAKVGGPTFLNSFGSQPTFPTLSIFITFPKFAYRSKNYK